jgi:hypothetical protein
MKYMLTLKSGVIMEVTSRDETKNIVGLLKWSLRQMTPQIIDFVECSIVATEIAVITPMVEEENE